MNRATREALVEERIEALEARLMYQDVTIETLNEAVTAQWREIDALRRQVAGLNERLSKTEADLPRPANEPPPHY